MRATFDLHVHSFFSDAQRPFSEVIDALVDNDIKIVGIADHVFPGAMYHNPKRFGTERRFHNCYSARLLRHRKTYLRLMDRKYKHKLRILVGGEVDILPAGILAFPPGITRADFDYVIGVKHHTLPKQLGFAFKRRPDVYAWLWKHDPLLRLNERLWEKEIYQAFRSGSVDILGHPQEGMPTFLPRLKMERLVLHARKFNVAIELNHLLENPRCAALLDLGHEHDVAFSLGSDFHGFQADLRKQLDHVNEMMALVERHDLRLLDPAAFLVDLP